MSLLSRYSNFVSDRGQNTKVCLIGAGQMGQGIVAQLNKMDSTDLVLIIDKNEEKLNQAKNRYKNNSEISLSTNIDALDETDLDIVIEATGTPSSGAEVAAKVLNRKIHLILLNVETEATIGLALNQEAKKNNCIVTVGDGDEPVAAVELYNFAKEISMDVIAIGKGKNNPFNEYAIPKDLEEEAHRKKMNPTMLTSFVDGSKTMIEMAALGNYLDFNIDIDGMHGPDSDYESLNSIFIPESSGGILTNTNVVDFAFGVAPGVFAIVYSEDDYVNYEMEYLKMGKGPYWTLYRPYHLTSLEIPRTIMKIMVEKESQLSATSWNIEVVAHAKTDLKAGTNLGSIGGDYIFGKAMKVQNAKGLAPLGLSENNILNHNVNRGDPIEINNLDMTENQLYKYWLMQNSFL
ncbi:MAG: NAD(P)H-dependent oxidoreductase [Candidatus Actinomarina sp.]|tara:strand:+ start:6067 stop:7281 length:1215 start_codon:yes stop_codon:yes gene_type:complete